MFLDKSENYYGKTEFTIACKNGHDDIVIILPIYG